jgi:hypothetical protein
LAIAIGAEQIGIALIAQGSSAGAQRQAQESDD